MKVREEAFKCGLSRNVKSLTLVHAAGERAKLLASRREEPYTSMDDEAFKSFFHALRIPNRTNGRASAQCSSAWPMKADIS